MREGGDAGGWGKEKRRRGSEISGANLPLFDYG